jgi:hypothetical protein
MYIIISSLDLRLYCCIYYVLIIYVVVKLCTSWNFTETFSYLSKIIWLIRTSSTISISWSYNQSSFLFMILWLRHKLCCCPIWIHFLDCKVIKCNSCSIFYISWSLIIIYFWFTALSCMTRIYAVPIPDFVKPTCMYREE